MLPPAWGGCDACVRETPSGDGEVADGLERLADERGVPGADPVERDATAHREELVCEHAAGAIEVGDPGLIDPPPTGLATIGCAERQEDHIGF